MNGAPIAHPEPADYPPFFSRYVDLVPPGDVLGRLAAQRDGCLTLFAGIDEARAAYRYAPDKWSLKQVLGHMVDTELVFLYRAVAFSRGEQASLPSFDENGYAEAAAADALPWTALVGLYQQMRDLSLAYFGTLSAEQLERTGIASGKEVRVRAFPFVLAGHELHHLNVLRERYGVG